MAMPRTWFVTNRTFARKIKNPQTKDAGVETSLECPNCKHLIDNSEVASDWPGLPAGVKFDPSDVELLEHLAGKIGLKDTKPHLLLNEFILMLEEDEGICYTHPQNLPGAKKDGSSAHFFHKVSNAYGRGHRKRRRINNRNGDESEECVRWHKTGKTKHVLENGKHRGWKKIMVLCRGRNTPKQGKMKKKANWVMHQYHIGPHEDEMEGEMVVSKVFYQQHITLQEQENAASQVEKKSEMEDCVNVEECGVFVVGVGPRTPITSEGGLLSRMKNKGSPFEAIEDNNLPLMLDQEEKQPAAAATSEHPPWWAGGSQAIIVDWPTPGNNLLLCGEALDSFPHLEDPSNIDCSNNDKNISFELPDLDSILIDTPPDFQLANLQFGSQESTMSWLDNFEKNEYES